ncbi:DUF2628 domain-containing protein [Aurantimonas sp. A2-1-M11]|uniref:DUF2628 domain-containing protein n=1 Tax=Aurantimonas sp. A2-1-M11 TaxID=3113712 RepID=UPI002F94886E
MGLKRFIVFEPQGTAGEGRSDRAVFVRDSFSFWAFLFTVLWLWRYRLWLEGLATLAVLIAISLWGDAAGQPFAASLLQLLVGILVALEGPSLRAWRYRRKGWRESATFLAGDRAEAEPAYYAADARPAETPERGVSAPAAGSLARRRGTSTRSAGFFGAMEQR